MPKSYTEKRVKFRNKAEQKTFIELAEKQIRGGSRGIASLGKVSIRQISDWRNAKSTLPLSLFERLLVIANIPRPIKIKIIERYSHAKSAGKKGFLAVLKKHGGFPKNEKHRKENWYKWWKTEGQYQKREIFKRLTIKVPGKSRDLAELCGIIIGDGGITKNQVIITLNCETDKAYSKFIVNLMQKLFNIKPKLYKRRDSKALNICISRSNLVDFLIKQGMKLGHKINQDVSIPQWIISSEKYLIACIRGMIDTDGCVVKETHFIKGKKYQYLRLNFTSASPLLIKQTVESLQKLGLNPKIRRKGQSVQLENIHEIWEYFKRVGTSNPKHIKRLGRIGIRKARTKK